MQPPAYNITTDFSNDEASALAGRSTVRTANLDTEFANVKLTLDALLTNIALLQRDDGALHDAIVTTDSLSANVKTLFGAGGITPRGAWVTATAYAVRDVVETLVPLISYICVVAHVSGVFATDRAAGKWMVLGAEPGVGVFTSITLSTGGITLGTNNTQDLAATGNRFRSGYFGTSVFAAVGLVAPLLQSTGAVDLVLGANGGTDWVLANAGKHWLPNVDNTQNLGSATKRVAALFAPIIDSGAAVSLSLKTNGATQLVISHTATAVNNWNVTGGAAGVSPFLQVTGNDADISCVYSSKGAGAHSFYTDAGGALQFQILRTAGSNRNITATGSNGGAPTLGVTAGTQLALSTQIAPNDILFPFAAYGTAALSARNSDNTGTIRLIDLSTVNALVNIIRIGDNNQNTRGVQLHAFTSGVPTTADLPAGWWAFYHDVGGATFKIYYNAAGVMKSIALG